MRRFASLVLIGLMATPVVAQSSSTAPKLGQNVIDAAGGLVGTVDEIEKDGSIQVMTDTKFIVIPAATLTVSGRSVKTSLTRKDINRL